MKASKSRTQPVNLRILSNGRQASTFSVSTAWQEPNPEKQQAGANVPKEIFHTPIEVAFRNVTERALARCTDALAQEWRSIRWRYVK